MTATAQAQQMPAPTDDGALVVLDPADVFKVFTTDGGLDPTLAKIRAILDGFEPDLSTATSRKAIASIAYKVSRSKTYLDDIGQELSAEQKKIPLKIDAARKKMRETLDLWRDEVRKPLTEWEQAEEARQKKHAAALSRLNHLSLPMIADVATLQARLAEAEAIEIDQTHKDDAVALGAAKERATAALKILIEQRIKHEAEQAELAELRRLKDERDREAAAAEAARLAAEQGAVRAAAPAPAVEEPAAPPPPAAAPRPEPAAVPAAAPARAAASDQDRVHRAKINSAALAALVCGGIDEAVARQVIVLIASGKIPRVAISY